MTAGLRIVNDYNTLQIDETYKNLQLTAKGLVGGWVTFQDNNGGSVQSSIGTVTVGGVNPVMALCANQPANVLCRKATASGEWEFSILVQGDANGKTIEFFIFDEVGFNTMSNYGIMIKNAAGEVVFHSDYAPLRIIDYRSGNSADGNTSETTTYTAGRKYAVLPSINGFYVQNFIISVLYGRFYTTTLGSVTSQTLSMIAGVFSFLPIPGTFRWGALMIDVTDL